MLSKANKLKIYKVSRDHTATKSKETRNIEDPDTEITDKSLIPTFGLLLTY